MYDFNEQFPDYDVDECGKVYKHGIEIKPFKSNKYLQVLLFDINHKSHVFGVHTVVAMKYLRDYTNASIVHHVDGNTHNNALDNLQVLSRYEHSRLHNKDNRSLANYVKEHGPVNKGRKMSKDFCQKCSISATLRGFNGNQFIDKSGNRR